MSRPLVSILTPSLNQARFLAGCIGSVANQTHRPIEHVICDGASTDGTLDRLRDAPDHVRWWSEPDTGQAHAVNKALERSRGSIVGWLNSDDAYADRRAVGWAVDAFERRPEIDVVFGHALLVNEDNVVLQLFWTPPVAEPLLRLAHYVYQPTVFFRREVLRSQPFFLREDLEFVFDRELLLRLSRAHVSVGWIAYSRSTVTSASGRWRARNTSPKPRASTRRSGFRRRAVEPFSGAACASRCELRASRAPQCSHATSTRRSTCVGRPDATACGSSSSRGAEACRSGHTRRMVDLSRRVVAAGIASRPVSSRVRGHRIALRPGPDAVEPRRRLAGGVAVFLERFERLDGAFIPAAPDTGHPLPRLRWGASPVKVGLDLFRGQAALKPLGKEGHRTLFVRRRCSGFCRRSRGPDAAIGRHERRSGRRRR